MGARRLSELSKAAVEQETHSATTQSDAFGATNVRGRKYFGVGGKNGDPCDNQVIYMPAKRASVKCSASVSALDRAWRPLGWRRTKAVNFYARMNDDNNQTSIGARYWSRIFTKKGLDYLEISRLLMMAANLKWARNHLGPHSNYCATTERHSRVWNRIGGAKRSQV